MTTIKPLNTEQDIKLTRTLLYEAIPLDNLIVSGTYGDQNIKNYSHGMFQSVYDYPYLSSSANHIFDITVGYNSTSQLYGLTVETVGQKSKKKNIYNQLAQILMGYDTVGSIQNFDQDGDLIGTGTKINSGFIIPFSRLLVKDEIKKETFEMTLGIEDDYYSPFSNTITISDFSASTEYRINSPAGEYGILYATASSNGILDITSSNLVTVNDRQLWYAGLIYYQAGIVILSSSVFATACAGGGGIIDGSGIGATNSVLFTPNGNLIDAALTGSSISASADGLRNRMGDIRFNNTTELNSTVYFCRANHNDFNYSSNPTYLSGSRMVVKSSYNDAPVSYITSVGLYNDNNELLAVAKLSEPLKKTPSNEYTLRVRLDY